MNAKDNVEVLRQQVNALLSIERELMQEHQAQLKNDTNGGLAVKRGKPPKSEAKHFLMSGRSQRRKIGAGINKP